MGEITIHLPTDLEASIESLVSRGIYKGKEDAIIALIRVGLNALRKREEPRVYAAPREPEVHPPAPPVKPPEKWPNHYEFRE